MSALPSHSLKSANRTARGGGDTAPERSKRIAGNITDGAENFGERPVSFTQAGPSALSALTTPSISDDAHDGIAARTAAGEKITIQDLTLDEIHIGPRHRQDMGDRQGLADSVDRNVLMQPIGVTADFVLVFGERRGKPAEEKMARGPQFLRQAFPRPLRIKDIKGVATDPLHRIAPPDRRPDETGSPLPARIVPPIKSRHRTGGGEGAAPFRSTRQGPGSRKYAAIRATTRYYAELKFMLADNQAAPEPHGSQRRGDAMNRQLAVLHPGALTPSDGSRRSIQRALEVKNALGLFTEWLTQTFPFSERTAQRWMRAAERDGSKNEVPSVLKSEVLQRTAAGTARAALLNAVRQAREPQQMSAQMAEAISAFVAPRALEQAGGAAP
jgi:hypothetical protein